MSTDQVPEEVPSAEAQLDALRLKLAGNAAFGRLRGRLGRPTVQLMLECGNGQSRVSAKQEWAELASAMAVMQTLLAQYRRDGWGVAEHELSRALSVEGYIITGETVPFEETEPYTIFMVDPDLTFDMIQLLQGWAHVDTYRDEDQPRFWQRLRDEGKIRDLYPYARGIIKGLTFPTTSSEDNGFGVWEDLIIAFGRRLQIPTKPSGRETTDLIPCNISNFRGCSDWRELTAENRLISNCACGFGKPCEQSRLLAAFGREDQRRIASWQFHLPKVMGFQRADRPYTVVFYHPSEQPRWEKERPQFASRGVSHGRGAIVVPQELLGDFLREKGDHFFRYVQLDNRKRNSS